MPTSRSQENTLPRWQQSLRRESRSLARMLRPRLWFWTTCAGMLPEFTLPSLRTHFYRLAGCQIAPQVAVLGRLKLLGDGLVASRLTVGPGSVIAPGVTFCLDGEITLGQNVSISPQTTLYTATHALGFGSRRMSPAVTPKAIVIEDGVWVGMHCLILPGVTLGQGCVVSAGSVVAADVAPNTLVAGNPATVQQQLPFGNR